MEEFFNFFPPIDTVDRNLAGFLVVDDADLFVPRARIRVRKDGFAIVADQVPKSVPGCFSRPALTVDQHQHMGMSKAA